MKITKNIDMLYVWRICLVSTLGGLLFGYDWVVIGGAKPFYEVYFNITSEALKGWAMSSALIGCMFGALGSGMLSDRFGRKKLLILSGALFAVSAIGCAMVDAFAPFIAYRIIGGVAIGFASNLSPMYISEVSPSEVRGRMVSINQLAIVLGIVVAQLVNWMIARGITDDLAGADLLNSWYCQYGWRWMFAAEVIPALLFFLLMFFVPESPRWRVQRGEDAHALRTLSKVGGAEYANNAVATIKKVIEQDKHIQGKLGDLFCPKLRLVLMLGIVLAVFQQFCGINVIFYYADEIFTAAGYELSGIMMNILTTGVVFLLFTLVATWSVDRVGRRFLMLFGSAGLCVIHALIAWSYMSGSTGIHVLILILAAIAFYAFSLAPITWVLIAELFPNRIRGRGMSISVIFLWVACAVVAQGFPAVNKAIGASGSFWGFSAICLFGFLFCWKYLPETKGKTLEELEQELCS